MLELKFRSWLFKAMFVILFNFTSSEKIAENIPYPRIIVLEDPLSLNPSLANILIGYPPETENGFEMVCQLGVLCSEGISVGTGRWLGEGINTAVINIKGMITDTETVLGNTIYSANLVIVEIDVSKETLDNSHLHNLRKLGSFLNIWNVTVLQHKNFDQNKSIKSKAEVLETYQTALKEEFDFVENLPGVFINVEDSKQDDEKTLQTFQAETSRLSHLITMMTLKDSVKQFLVLQSENDKLKDENKNLKDEIIQLDNEIAFLQVETKRLFQVDENTCNALDKHKQNLKKVKIEKDKQMDNLKQEFQENLRKVKIEKDKQMDNLKQEFQENLRKDMIEKDKQIVNLKKAFQEKIQVQKEEHEQILQLVTWKFGMDLEETKKLKIKLRERPECTSYTTLSDYSRSVNHGDGTRGGSTVNGKWRCDLVEFNSSSTIVSPGWKGPAWYRFTMPAGTRIPESSPGIKHCGTYLPGWLSESHPTSTAESVDVKFCFHSNNGDSCYYSSKGKITNCGSFFVYYLQDTPECPLRYCATN